jgi:RNA polymerase sigma-70 factor (ECF subfamily)
MSDASSCAAPSESPQGPCRRPYQEAAEGDLIAWCREGDGVAFEWLVRPHLARIESLCRSIVRDPDEVLDAVQLCLSRIWAGLPRFQGRPRFSSWLWTTARNAALEVNRAADHQRVDRRPGGVEPSRGEDSALAESVVWADAVRWALGQLPPELRAAVVLLDVEGVPCSEIAALEGVSVNTVRWRICRGRRALRVLLEDEAS